jgi:hypothetical protein
MILAINLNEAKYFLERLKETNRDKDAFRYNLSAFLSALCSVPGIMNIEFQSIPGFISWNKGREKLISRPLNSPPLPVLSNGA